MHVKVWEVLRYKTWKTNQPITKVQTFFKFWKKKFFKKVWHLFEHLLDIWGPEWWHRRCIYALVYLVYALVKVLVAQSCLTLCNFMDCSLPGSSVLGDSPGKNTVVGSHSLLQGILPAHGSNQVSCTAGRFFTIWGTREALVYVLNSP